jgi:hypothetical protein
VPPPLPPPGHQNTLPSPSPLGIPTLLPSVIGFVEGLLVNAPRPVFTWTIDPTSGAITIVSKTQPHKVAHRDHIEGGGGGGQTFSLGSLHGAGLRGTGL